MNKYFCSRLAIGAVFGMCLADAWEWASIPASLFQSYVHVDFKHLRSVGMTVKEKTV